MNGLLASHAPFLNALLAAAAVGTACAVLSVFVVLLKWAFIGEGISHAGFGGAGTAAVISLAWPSLGGDAAGYAVAVFFCFATAGAIGWVSRRKRVSGDAAIGVFVVASLAWGFVAFAIREHLTRRLGAAGGWDTYLVGDAGNVSRASMLAGIGVSAAVLLIVITLGKEILLYCFDATLAEVSGIPVAFIHYLLVMTLAMVIVAGMKLLGVLLAPAMLILPGALALALSTRLRTVLVLSVATTLIAVVFGLTLAVKWPFIPAGPAIVLVLFVEFILAMALRPRGG